MMMSYELREKISDELRNWRIDLILDQSPGRSADQPESSVDIADRILSMLPKLEWWNEYSLCLGDIVVGYIMPSDRVEDKYDGYVRHKEGSVIVSTCSNKDSVRAVVESMARGSMGL